MTAQPTPARLVCDRCAAALEVPRAPRSIGHPWRVAAREEWLVVPGECLCPSCQTSRSTTERMERCKSAGR